MSELMKLASQLAQELNNVVAANERFKEVQRRAYVITMTCTSNGTASEVYYHPTFVES